jgi:ABC-2 type transport system ATP-binding protein
MIRPMPALEARNLWRYYGREPAVQGLDITVEAGSAYGFIGPNGAGKSTTLRILATADLPDAGRVWVQGVDAARWPERVRPALGFMPDPFHLWDELSVEDTLAFFALTYGVPARERRGRVERAIELARVTERRRSKCGGLSKGWKQRVLLAKTLVHDPQVLLLDEPASGLDPAARIEFREIVRTLRDLGKAIVVSSHILTELAGFCDSVGIVEKGRMLVSGRIEEILGRLDPHDRLEVELASDPQLAGAALAGFPGVARTEVAEPGPPGRLVVHLQGRSTPETRAHLVRRLVLAGAAVGQVTCKREGLEELFLKVAGKQTDLRGVLAPDVLRALLARPEPSGSKEEGA